MSKCEIHGKVEQFPCEKCFATIEGKITTDNKAPLDLPEPEPTSSLEYKMLWHSHKELQLRLEKCEGLLRECRDIFPDDPFCDDMADKIEKYFAEVEK